MPLPAEGDDRIVGIARDGCCVVNLGFHLSRKFPQLRILEEISCSDVTAAISHDFFSHSQRGVYD